jgi:hypothetical protein
MAYGIMSDGQDGLNWGGVRLDAIPQDIRTQQAANDASRNMFLAIAASQPNQQAAEAYMKMADTQRDPLTNYDAMLKLRNQAGQGDTYAVQNAEAQYKLRNLQRQSQIMNELEPMPGGAIPVSVPRLMMGDGGQAPQMPAAYSSYGGPSASIGQATGSAAGVTGGVPGIAAAGGPGAAIGAATGAPTVAPASGVPGAPGAPATTTAMRTAYQNIMASLTPEQQFMVRAQSPDKMMETAFKLYSDKGEPVTFKTDDGREVQRIFKAGKWLTPEQALGKGTAQISERDNPMGVYKNDTEAKAGARANEMILAEKKIQDFTDSGRTLGSTLGSKVPFTNDYFTSPEFKQLQQAAREWGAAKLYHDTGATASPAEIDEKFKTFIPQVNDDAATIEQKRQARLEAMRGVIGAAGQNYRGPNVGVKEHSAPIGIGSTFNTPGGTVKIIGVR